MITVREKKKVNKILDLAHYCLAYGLCTVNGRYYCKEN